MFLQLCHIHMFVSESFRLIKSYSINNWGVIESVTDDCIFRSKDSFEETSVGIESTWEKDTILNFIIVSDNLFQFFMDILGAANKPYRTHSKSVSIESFFGSFDESGMIGKSKIIISTEVQYLFAISSNKRRLRWRNNSLFFISAWLFNRLDLFG